MKKGITAMFSIALLLLIVSFASGVGSARSPEEPSPRPNLVLIVLDEWGYFEMSEMGHRDIRTPRIDRLAQAGMRFTQLLAGGPTCAPTRATLMLGQHMGHTSMRSNGGYDPIRDDDVTMAEVLRDAGYATGGFGKWGIGGRGTSGVPERQGFDTFFGYYDQRHAHTYYPAYLIRNSEEVPQAGNSNDFFTGENHAQVVIFNEAMSWLGEQDQESPFFLYLPFTVPHGQWGFPEDDPAWAEFKDRPWNAGQRRPTDARVYAAMMRMVDRQIGQLVTYLEEYDLAENTMILLTGDNGGQDYFASEDRPRGFFAPNVDPRTGVAFRGQKRQLYEGGLRIPAIAYWPGRIDPGQVSDHLAYFPDVFPTLSDLAGAQVPSNLDGISFAPTLLNEIPQEQHGYLYWEYGNQRAVRSGNWKAVLPGDGEAWELYDLQRDISESQDLAEEYPSILKLLQAMAIEAHRPIQPGAVLDVELATKDGRQPPY